MDDRPAPLGYASPGIARVSPPVFPAMTLVGPFAVGAMVATFGVVIWTYYNPPTWASEDLASGFGVAWGQAAGFLVAVKAWTGIVHREQTLVARRWWISVPAGAGSIALYLAVVCARSWAMQRTTGPSDALINVIGLCADGAYFVACAVVLTRGA